MHDMQMRAVLQMTKLNGFTGNDNITGMLATYPVMQRVSCSYICVTLAF